MKSIADQLPPEIAKQLHPERRKNDGILDALFGWTHKPQLAARFVLEEVGWHPVNSAPIAYYWTAKIIVQSILAKHGESH